MQHRFPLHRISYCADDKSDKRIFTFIAKEQDSNKHHCFVFDSEKCVSVICVHTSDGLRRMYRYNLVQCLKDSFSKPKFLDEFVRSGTS